MIYGIITVIAAIAIIAITFSEVIGYDSILEETKHERS